MPPITDPNQNNPVRQQKPPQPIPNTTSTRSKTLWMLGAIAALVLLGGGIALAYPVLQLFFAFIPTPHIPPPIKEVAGITVMTVPIDRVGSSGASPHWFGETLMFAGLSDETGLGLFTWENQNLSTIAKPVPGHSPCYENASALFEVENDASERVPSRWTPLGGLQSVPTSEYAAAQDACIKLAHGPMLDPATLGLPDDTELDRTIRITEARTLAFLKPSKDLPGRVLYVDGNRSVQLPLNWEGNPFYWVTTLLPRDEGFLLYHLPESAEERSSWREQGLPYWVVQWDGQAEERNLMYGEWSAGGDFRLFPVSKQRTVVLVLRNPNQLRQLSGVWVYENGSYALVKNGWVIPDTAAWSDSGRFIAVVLDPNPDRPSLPEELIIVDTNSL